MLTFKPFATIISILIARTDRQRGTHMIVLRLTFCAIVTSEMTVPRKVYLIYSALYKHDLFYQ